MRRTVIAVYATVLALSAVHAGAETSSSTQADDSATKILKFIEWVGSLDDLSAATNSVPSALGLSAEPHVEYFDHDGQQRKDWTAYLRDTPIWPGARSSVVYAVFEPDGPSAAQLRAGGAQPRAGIVLSLNATEVCVRMTDMIARFGKPTETHRVLHAGGTSYGWTLRQKPWKTLVEGYFGIKGDTCTADLSIGEVQ